MLPWIKGTQLLWIAIEDQLDIFERSALLLVVQDLIRRTGSSTEIS